MALEAGGQPGAIDASFNPGLGLTSPPPGSYVSAIELQTDGRILIGGSFTAIDGTQRSRLARLESNGALDTGFNAPITASASGVFAIALQADQKILVGGDFVSVGGFSRPGVARFHQNGALDDSFAFVEFQVARVRAIALQPDGGVILGGDFGPLNGIGRNLARLDTHGVQDPGFATTVGPAGYGWGSDPVHSIVRLPDGRLLIAGDFLLVNGESRSRIARLLPDGSLDPSFDPGPGPNGTVFRVLRQSDDRVVIGGFFTAFDGHPRPGIARLNRDGTLDTSFHPLIEPSNAWIYALGLQADGKLIAGGVFSSVAGHPAPGVARLHADGSLDPTFVPETSIRGASAIGIQTDGRLVLGGWSIPGGMGSTGGIVRVLGGPYPFRVCSIHRLVASGEVMLETLGDPGATVTLETSPDLKNWTVFRVIHRIHVAEAITDDTAASVGVRFYRAAVTSAP